jgi:hypothetical protein
MKKLCLQKFFIAFAFAISAVVVSANNAYAVCASSMPNTVSYDASDLAIGLVSDLASADEAPLVEGCTAEVGACPKDSGYTGVCWQCKLKKKDDKCSNPIGDPFQDNSIEKAVKVCNAKCKKALESSSTITLKPALGIGVIAVD